MSIPGFRIAHLIRILIETKWNLNYDVWIEKGLVTVILIETKWNLNRHLLLLLLSHLCILIETKWNLNLFNCSLISGVALYINRNKVEFK